MSATQILGLDGYILVYGSAFVVASKLLNSTINMRGLLADKSRPAEFSPERAQLLVSTIAVTVRYLHATSLSEEGSFPKIGTGWLYLFGASSVIYGVRKIVERRRNS